MRDIRDDLFRSIYGRRFRAALTAERAGVLAGTEAAKARRMSWVSNWSSARRMERN